MIEALGGRRRAGFAILGAFAIGPVMVVAGIVFQFVEVHRYRLPGGGVMRRGDIFIVPGAVDLRPVLASVQTSEAEARRAIEFLTSNTVDARIETGQQIVAFHQAEDDRVAFVGVLRMDASSKGVLWIDEEPIELAGDRCVDAASLRPAP